MTEKERKETEGCRERGREWEREAEKSSLLGVPTLVQSKAEHEGVLGL